MRNDGGTEGNLEMDTVTIQLPLDILQAAKVPEDQAATEVKKMIVLFLYDRGTISLAKACELLSISQWEFFELNRELGLTIHYDIEDYREDLNAAKSSRMIVVSDATPLISNN